MLDIPTYWNVEGLYYVFSGIASILGSGAYRTLIKLALMIGLAIATWTYVAGRQWQSFSWIFSALGLMAILTLPYGPVAIVDRTGTQPPRTVSNVPVFLVATGAITAKIGDWLTRTFEAVFTLPDELKLGNNDLAFGHRLLQKMNQVTLMDSPLRADLIQFFKECTAYDIRDGVLNPNALANSVTGWADVFRNTNPARFVSFNVGSANAGFDTCVNVANGGGSVLPNQALAARVQNAVTALRQFYGRELNPNATSPVVAANAFDTQIAAAYNFILGSSQSASDALQQAMFVNVFREAQGDIAILLNDPAAIAQLNAETQAAAATNAGLIAQANFAQETLPRVRNIIEVFLYVVFPVVVLLCLVSSPQAAANILAFYILGLAWIALWPVLFAVLNFLMTLHLAAKAKAVFLALNGVPLQHQNLLAGMLISEQALIGSLAYAVPAIAGGLVFLSRGPMTSAFSSLAATGQSQAMSEAAGTSKGNYAIGQAGLNTVSENLTLKARYDGDSHFLSGFHTGRVGTYSVTQMQDGNYVVNRPMNQLGIQASDGFLATSGTARTASDTFATGRTRDAGFRIGESATYNESVGRWETRGTSQDRSEGWSKTVSGSNTTQGGQGFTYGHAAEMTAAFERVSGARAHGGLDFGVRGAASADRETTTKALPQGLQSGIAHVGRAGGLSHEEARHIVEARNRNMTPEQIVEHVQKLRERSATDGHAANMNPPGHADRGAHPAANSRSTRSGSIRGGIGLGAEKTLAAQTARAIRAADSFLRTEDGRRYSQIMAAYSYDRTYREGEQSRQENRFDRSASLAESTARDRGERVSATDSRQLSDTDDRAARRTGSFTEQILIDGRELDAAARRANIGTGSALPGLSMLGGQSLTPMLRGEIENRLAERAAMSELFMGNSSRVELEVDADAAMMRSHSSVDPRAVHVREEQRTGYTGTRPLAPGSISREVTGGLQRNAEAADASADRRFTDERLRELEIQAREESSIDRNDEATNRSATAAVGRATLDETVETARALWRRKRSGD